MRKQATLFLALFAVAISPIATSSPAHAQAGPKDGRFWWPRPLNFKPLRQHAIESNQMGEAFNYAEEFKSLDLKALKKDIEALMTTSRHWSPADYGHYGLFFVRMAWVSYVENILIGAQMIINYGIIPTPLVCNDALINAAGRVST